MRCFRSDSLPSVSNVSWNFCSVCWDHRIEGDDGNLEYALHGGITAYDNMQRNSVRDPKPSRMKAQWLGESPTVGSKAQ